MADKQYLDLVRQILDHGEKRPDRTGTGILSIFGTQSRYDLREGFPLLTTKKVRFDAVVHELLWFLRGSTNINDGLTAFTPIWDAWADADGELGPVYGWQWRRWGAVYPYPISDPRGDGCDQIAALVEGIKRDPFGRRHIVTAWNPDDIGLQKLPPCHILFQCYVGADESGRPAYLDLQMYQRSADIALGVPFNIASYALLLTLLAHEVGLMPRHFVHTIGDAHVYLNHVEGLRTQLEREPYPLPYIELEVAVFLDEMMFESIALHEYVHHPFIKFEVAV